MIDHRVPQDGLSPWREDIPLLLAVHDSIIPRKRFAARPRARIRSGASAAGECRCKSTSTRLTCFQTPSNIYRAVLRGTPEHEFVTRPRATLVLPSGLCFCGR